MKKTIRLVVGIALIVIGLLGLVAPIIPGIPLLFVGLELAGIGFLIPGVVRKLPKDLYRKWKDRNNGQDQPRNM